MEHHVKEALEELVTALSKARGLGLERLPTKSLQAISKMEEELKRLRDKTHDHGPEPGLSQVTSLEQLEQLLHSCQDCQLSATRKNVVVGEGSKRPLLMLVGEAPGREEDVTGRPFVGKSGELLTKMLRAINLSRSEVYITSVVKCRPPRNRTPHRDEIAACLPYLHKQIELLDPALLLCLGSTAAHALLNTENPLSKLRGRFYSLGKRKVLVTYHPAYLLRFGGSKLLNLKKQAWQDLQMLQREYERLKRQEKP
ncbi:MAG: uracil-DNA glycosylase [Thermodesulfobacteria bacterium]|nr:uracil-DNA glycosylase [Thermodesulfobacteriota bacterium]